MSGALIVVDMQARFAAANNPQTQQACVREIEQAMKNRDAILFVEYANCGPTLPNLVDVVKKAKYKRSYHVIKYDDDGGKEVIAFLKDRHLPRLNLRVVGVNTAYCVKQTVYGMKRNSKNSTISVIADACHSEWGVDEHQQALASLRKRGVKVLNDSKKK